jgi:hypothetical protein
MTITGNKKFVHTLMTFGAMLLSCGMTFAQDNSQATSNTATREAPSASDQYLALLRKDIRSEKKQIIAANMDFTDGEAEKFWPIYDRYTADLAKINDTKVDLIKDYAQNYGSMTSEQAVAYIKGRAAVEESANSLRLKYVPIFGRVLSGRQTAKFFQVEWRVSLLIDVQLASQMPIIEP